MKISSNPNLGTLTRVSITLMCCSCTLYLDRNALAFVPQPVADGLIRNVSEHLLELLDRHLGCSVLAGLGFCFLCPALLAPKVAHNMHHQPPTFNLPVGSTTVFVDDKPVD